MPIYDFRCRECGKVSEIFLRGADGQVTRCPDCGSDNLGRLISAVLYGQNGCASTGHYLLRQDGALRNTSLLGRRHLPKRIEEGIS
ncbi:MAG: zinc ribbon domain-containing protein [Chloroflexi bacterium]|nr:zinc ribbon domain-containing protein [Chloroflexota bacterium]